MNFIKVSVAIPAYKAKFLEFTIESILNQTISDWELIIVNDCSPEDITSVVSHYKDSRIRYYINEKNIGGQDPVANWNKCLSYATGEFFCLLCDDDVYEPTFLESMLNLSSLYPKCCVFKSGVQVIDAQNKVISTYPESPVWESCAEYIFGVSLRKRKQTISEWMFRRQCMLDCHGYEGVPMAWGADYLSIMKFAVHEGIAASNDKLVTFRKSGENISTVYDKNLEKKLLGTKVYTEKMKKMISENSNLQSLNLELAVEKIRVFELNAAMSMASPSKIWSIRKIMPSVGIPTTMWMWAIVKNMIKRVVR